MTADTTPGTTPGGWPAGGRSRVIRRRPRVYPDPAEVAPVAAEVSHLRRQTGLSQRALARRAACHRRTIQRLETGRLRPRWSLLGSLANALDPDRRGVLLVRLVAAAGDHLAEDTPGTLRWRRRKMEAGMLAGSVPLPSRVARALELHRQADAAYAGFLAALDRPGAVDDPDLLADAERLHHQAEVLRAEAGPPVVLCIGARRVTAGWGAP